MIVGSVCSGIGAPEVAWRPLGWQFAFCSEIEAFPSAVLKYHYPEVPNLGDFTTIKRSERTAIDLLVGGTPCQDFSVAGLRAGMAGDRGNLTLQFLKLADRLRPKWLVWENVPGVLSSNGGRDFGSFLGGLGQLGYGFAYRVLDAQFFGVPQRRRRVFVVGCLGDWRRAAAVLFEQHSLSGHPAPSREKGQSVAGTFKSRAKSGGWCQDVDLAAGGYMQPYTPSSHAAYTEGVGTVRANGGDLGGGSETLIAGGSFDWPAEVAQTLDTHYGDKMGLEDQHIRGGQVSLCLTSHYAKGGDPTVDQFIEVPLTKHGGFFDTPKLFSIMPMNSGKDFKAREVEVAQPLMTNPVGGNQGGDYVVQTQFGDVAGALTARHDSSPCADRGMNVVAARDQHAVAFKYGQGSKAGGLGIGDVSPTLGSADSGTQLAPGMLQGMAVRRLTPRECERLQGFPDDYTLIPWRGKLAPDGPRYKAIGNSMACNVMRWLGRRIEMVEMLSSPATISTQDATASDGARKE